MVTFEKRQGRYVVSCDPSRLNLDVIHGFLTESYWAYGITKEKVENSIRHSLCFGLYDGDSQIGFARVLSDYTHFGLLADVFVLESHRKKGLGKFLVGTVLEHPALQGLRRFTLATKDAHGLYAKLGFQPLSNPERFMERGKQTF